MDVVPELDAGDVYLEKRQPIGESDTSETLFASLAELGGQALIEALPGLLSEQAVRRIQDESRVTHAAMLTKEEGEVVWADSATTWSLKSRAFTPWPGLYTQVNGKPFKLHGAKPVTWPETNAKPGTVLALDNSIVMQMGEGALSFSHGQPPGKKPQTAAELRNGGFLKIGQILGV